MLGAWLVLLALAPPAHNAFWGVNGLRSVAPLVACGIALAALLATIAALRPPRVRWVPALVAAAIATTLAFPLREQLHLLGDTATRQGALITYARSPDAQSLAGWARQLHAQPLDLALGLLLPGRLATWTDSPALAFSLVSCLLALVYLAGAWRLAARLVPEPAATWGLWLALIAWGGIEAYAGYAESAGVSLAAAVWFWAAMFTPLSRTRVAFALVASWAIVALAHRVGLVLLAPLALRLLGPAFPGDAPRARRRALVASLLAALAIVFAGMRSGGGQLAIDLRELFRMPARDAFASLPTDLVNLLLLSAPLAVVGVVAGGRGALAQVLREPRARLLLVTAVLLAPLAFPLPVAPNGLGVHRDWDLSVLFALALTLLGAQLLATLPAARLRGVLVAAMPVLVLGAGGWVAVNADLPASLRRTQALANEAPALGAIQRSSVLMFYGNTALSAGEAAFGAHMLVRSWQLVPSPSRGMHAVMGLIQAGDAEGARIMLAAMRERGLTPQLSAHADTLGTMIDALERKPPSP